MITAKGNAKITGKMSVSLQPGGRGFQKPVGPLIRLGLPLVLTLLVLVLAFLILPYLVVLGPWGYVGGFIINLISSSLIIVPGPGFAALLVMAKDLDPFILGIAAGIGGTFGELTGYWLGAQGRGILEGKPAHLFIMRCMTRIGGSVILLFGLVPFIPVDVAGVLAGASGYPVSKFLFYLGVGKTIMSVAILYLAARAFDIAGPFLPLVG